MEDVSTHGYLILQDFAFKFFMGSKKKMQSLDKFESLSAKCILNSTFMENTAGGCMAHGFKKRPLVRLSLMNRKGCQILALFHFKSLNIQESE